MKIKSFTIKNYRSIKAFKIDNLNPVNVFFGKNNVGKSNILRGLHLAFYCLKNDEIYLPDTMFYNRNIYKPIEITVELILEEDFCHTEEIREALNEETGDILLVDTGVKVEIFEGVKEMEQFIIESKSFQPVKKLRLRMYLDYNEKTSDVRFSIKDLESDYKFDYGRYKNLYKKLRSVIGRKISERRREEIQSMLAKLSSLGVDMERVTLPYHWDVDVEGPRDIERIVRQLRHYIIDVIKESSKRNKALAILEQYREALAESKDNLIEPISKIFNIVKEYFEKISDNFILIPNKEYFPKGPFAEKNQNGEQIEIFDIDRFEDKLLSLIESPGKKERVLIQQFNSIFGRSYADLGELEIRRFREKVFAIFDTGFTALPIENQGLGVQDLFLYLAHMILFDPAIVAIEEPEGGLSTENQRILHDIMEKVYLQGDKQIFISSHSEEFETPSSYVIEIGKDGTKEISRMEKEKEYEKKIEKVLIKRKLEEEKEQYEALLKKVTERQMALDILNYIDKLPDKEKLDSEKISHELGYKKEKVEEVFREIVGKRA